MKYFGIISFVLLILLAGCGEKQSKKASPATLSGTITNHDGALLLLEEIGTKKIVAIDSVRLDEDGDFSFRTLPKDFGFYILSIPSQDQILPIIMMEGKHFTLNTEDNLLDAEILESETNKTLQNYFKVQDRDRKLMDSLYAYWDIHKYDLKGDRIKDSLMNCSHTILETHREFTDNILNGNLDQPYSLLIISQRIGNEKLYDFRVDSTKYSELSHSLLRKYPENSYVIDLQTRLSDFSRKQTQEQLSRQRLLPGGEAPNLSLPDTNNTYFNLNELHGNSVILAFVGSWEKPTYDDIKTLKSAVKSGLLKESKIFMVSMDILPDPWHQTARAADWNVVSDQQGGNSPIVTLYNLPSRLPCYYLIDSEGKIVINEARLSRVLEYYK